MNQPHLHLISFPLCPFVQRSVIVLKYKKVPFDLTFINIKEPPAWFLEQSPTGKVPLLIVDRETPIFESAVISEFIDEISPPPLMPTDPLERAKTRAWIAFVSETVMSWHHWITAANEDAFKAAAEAAGKGLQRLDGQCRAEPYFTGAEFSLLDAALAPLIMRFSLLPDPLNPWQPERYPNLNRWWQTLSALPEVQNSVPEDFRQRLATMLQSQESFTGPRLSPVLIV